MSNSRHNTDKRKRSESTDMGKVGYGKPPKHTQFKKGKSGNPKGRPRGRKNSVNSSDNQKKIANIVLQEVREPVTVKMGERNVDMSFIQANVKTMKKRAVNGDARAQEKLIDLAKKAEDEVEGQKVQIAAAMIEYKYAWLNEFKYLGRLRLERPILPIDPETLFINPETGDVESLVPLNQEEQENYSWALDKKQKILDEISDLRKFEITSKEDQDLVRDEIAHLQGRIDLIDRHFPISEVDYSDWL